MLFEITSCQYMLAFGMPSGWEWIVLLLLGLLIFGRRLPEVGKSLARGIVEFKRGIKDIETEIDEASNEPPSKHLTDQAAAREEASRQDEPHAAASTSTSQPRESSGA